MELTLCLGEPPARTLDGITAGVEERKIMGERRRRFADTPVKLNLLSFVPSPQLDSKQMTIPWKKEEETWDLDSPLAELEVKPKALSSSPIISKAPSLNKKFISGDTSAPEMLSSRGSDQEENDGGRKKLRLSKEQSAFLEESFKEQSTLNPKIKFVLAKQLNLRPRQVEVWFQNRRARTKLKQMEMDCELLKRRCESLREENIHLHNELAELRSHNDSKPFGTQFRQPAALSMCPSCERISSFTASPPPPPPQTPR